MSTRCVIGIVGKVGAGKDTFAEELKPQGYHRIAFGDALKRHAMGMFDLTYAQVHGSLAEKKTVDPRWGLSPRQILQRLGTETARSVHPSVWIEALKRDLVALENGRTWIVNEGRWVLGVSGGRWPTRFVVPDVRFPDEAQALRDMGGVIVRVIRPDFAGTSHAEHASETEQEAIAADYTVFNGNRISDLRQRARAIAKEQAAT